jgi:hypothetical protein
MRGAYFLSSARGFISGLAEHSCWDGRCDVHFGASNIGKTLTARVPDALELDHLVALVECFAVGVWRGLAGFG